MTVLFGCSLEPKGLRQVRAHTYNLKGIAHGFPMEHANRYCSYCHGLGLDGGEKGEPSCYTCHGRRWPLLSEDESFATEDHTELHGGRYLHHPEYENPIGTCDTCHGSNLEGDIVENTPSCFLCHEQLW